MGRKMEPSWERVRRAAIEIARRQARDLLEIKRTLEVGDEQRALELMRTFFRTEDVIEPE